MSIEVSEKERPQYTTTISYPTAFTFWLIERGLTSPPTQYRLETVFRGQKTKVTQPTQQYQSTEGKETAFTRTWSKRCHSVQIIQYKRFAFSLFRMAYSLSRLLDIVDWPSSRIKAMADLVDVWWSHVPV